MFCNLFQPIFAIRHKNPKFADFWVEFGLQIETRDDTGSLEVLDAPLGLLSDLASKKKFPKHSWDFTHNYTDANAGWEMLNYGEPPRVIGANWRPVHAPIPPPSLPACCCLAYQRCCWCCWMLHGGAAQIQLRIWGWRREDNGSVGSD